MRRESLLRTDSFMVVGGGDFLGFEEFGFV